MTKKADLAKHLLALYERNNGITPQQVVDDARDPDSPIHSLFEWDDSIAAEKYRVEQARSVIRRVELITESKEIIIRTPQYIKDQDKAGDVQGYKRVEDVRTDDDLKRDSIVAECVRAAAALRRARDLARYFGLEDMVNESIQSVRFVHEQIETRQ